MGSNCEVPSLAAAGVQPVEVRSKGREKRYLLRDALNALEEERPKALPPDRRKVVSEVLREFTVPREALVPWMREGATELRRRGFSATR